jgi:hypothetical protein
MIYLTPKKVKWISIMFYPGITNKIGKFFKQNGIKKKRQFLVTTGLDSRLPKYVIKSTLNRIVQEMTITLPLYFDKFV